MYILCLLNAATQLILIVLVGIGAQLRHTSLVCLDKPILVLRARWTVLPALNTTTSELTAEGKIIYVHNRNHT